MEDQVAITVKLWEKSLEASAYFHKRGDEAVKFYIGVNTALSAWLLTNAANSPTFIFAVIALGVFGTGHVAYYHNRGFKLQRRANRIAEVIAQLLHLSEAIKDLTSSDDFNLKDLLVPGYFVTQIAFNTLIVIATSLVYAFVLLLKMSGR